jgi:hypothetical protein
VTRTEFAVALFCMLLASVLGWPSPANAAGAADVFSIDTTHNVDIYIAAEGHVQQVLYRDATDTWRVLPVEMTDGVAHLKIDVATLNKGRTLLVLDAPAGINMDDREPPAVVQINIDGYNYGSVTSVALGGVEAAPRRVAIEIEDELSSLRTRSLRVNVNSRRYALRDAGVELKRISPRRAVVVLDISKLLSSLSSENMITVSMDDYAIDDRALNCSISFRHTPPHDLADGTRLSVDTVTTKAGWETWWVVADGEKMDSSYPSTAGYTWRSLDTPEPHWIKMEFPEPRAVSGVALWWAYWQVFHSSAAYKVQTWDGQEWVTQVAVEKQTTQQCSQHVFGPVVTKAIRVWQPAMSGHPREQATMWISELEVL